MTYPHMTQSVDSELGHDPAVTANGRRLAGKRVAMVVYSPYPNDPRPRRALNALVEEGASVDLICLASGNAPRREVLDGIDILRVPLRHQRGGIFGYAYQYGAFILISTIVFALRSWFRPYDLVYVHNMPDILVLSSLIPKALGAKVVLDLHDPMPELMMTIYNVSPDSKSVRLLKRLEKWSIARTNLVVTVNVACKRIFSSRSCQPEKIAVVMNAPDSRIFPFRVSTSHHSANQSNDKPFVVMYHGSIVERNGLDLAIDAVARVRQVVPNVVLRVFGSTTPFLERMKDDVRKRKLEGVVHFLGSKSLEDIVKEIETCDLGVIPNHHNAFTEINTPTRIFEYLALGKPVIAPSTLGIQDYFSNSSLLFFEPGNPADLAREIEYAFNHPREVLEIAQRGQRVYLNHTWEFERETLLHRLSETLRMG
jgi:glycosyltransferase involved in cell wall biosynthesis